MPSFKMKVFIFALAVVVTVNCYNIEVQQLDSGLHLLNDDRATNKLDWWQTAVFYQIYPRSFMDSNNDGIGDLQGIIQKLDYLKELGVTAAWLSPIYKSPQVDQGYDISDLRDIDPDYGTLDDFKTLLTKAHALGIKIILDFVPNHTSDQHNWFKLSRNRTEGFEDFYVWKNCTVVDGVVTPPNNWISNFKDSAWEYDETRQQCYLHQFAIQQPDLNYRNPDVVKAMKNVLIYWMDLGVDGFRCDAVNFMFEDAEFRDEPLSNTTGMAENDYGYLDHIYTLDQNETYYMIYEFRKVLDDYTTANKTETKVMMTEAYTTIAKTMPYYGISDGSTKGAHFTFNFNFITSISKNFTIADLKNCIQKWLVNLPSIYTSNWVLGNHDNHRVATRFGTQYIDAFNMITAILPGVMVTYNGEEIGMEDGDVNCTQGHDPQAIKDCTTFAKYSRDFERTPFQWNNSTNAGFNQGNTTWLPVAKNYKEVNVAAENVTGLNSHYNIYKALLEMRKNFNKTSSLDSLSIEQLSTNVVQIVRQTDNYEYDLILNIGSETKSVEFMHKTGDYRVVVASVNSSYKVNDTIANKTLYLNPYESVILYNTLAISAASRLMQLPVVLIANILLISIGRFLI